MLWVLIIVVRNRRRLRDRVANGRDAVIEVAAPVYNAPSVSSSDRIATELMPVPATVSDNQALIMRPSTLAFLKFYRGSTYVNNCEASSALTLTFGDYRTLTGHSGDQWGSFTISGSYSLLGDDRITVRFAKSYNQYTASSTTAAARSPTACSSRANGPCTAAPSATAAASDWFDASEHHAAVRPS